MNSAREPIAAPRVIFFLMRVSFYAPFKALDSPIPSGDREIARSLFAFFESKGDSPRVLSRFESFLFYRSLRRTFATVPALLRAFGRTLWFRPTAYFTYHHYYRAPDVLHPLLALLTRKPYYIFEGMYSRNSRGRVPLWVWWWTRFALRRATHVFSDKPDDIAGLSQILPASRITYIPPALDRDFFSPGAARKGDIPVIACVAMLRADRKSEGVRFLIEALAGIDLPYRFVLVGGGPCETEIRELARVRLGAKASVIGQRERAEVRDILRGADIFAFPGLDEGIGLVYLEAQACGLPCVAFDNGGTPFSIAQNETGFLTPLMDLEAYRAALRKLLESCDLRERMGARAVARIAAEFDQRFAYEKMHDIIQAGAR